MFGQESKVKIHKYKTYSEYEKVQQSGYEKKKNLIWASKANIKCICDNVLKDKYIINDYGRGLCHGVRTGIEIDWFLEYLPGWKVIGTEIGESKNDYIFRWDFNKINTAWIEKFDFVYSNSFDHAYKPKETLAVWRDQLRSGGIMIIEHSSGHENITELDPFGATVDDIEIMLLKYGKLKDVKVLKMPDKNKYNYRCIITGVK